MAKSTEPKSEKLKAVYAERNVEDQRATYRDWADTYDQQTVEEFGWMGFESAAAEFSKRVKDKNSRILDAGCGTGLSGKALASEGFTNIHGRDLSPEMLAKADGLNVYKSLGECDLTNTLREEPFDHIISVGVFGFGPPYPEHIKHLVAITKPGGFVMLTVNGKGWVDKNWAKILPETIDEQGLNLVEQLEIEYLSKEEISGKFLVFSA